VELIREACISECGKYRYWLSRRWGDDGGSVLWIMLNPSTADATRDDPTIRRCTSFARRWGYDGIHVVNLFAWRETRPQLLGLAADPVGPMTDEHIKRLSQLSSVIVAAWGAHGERYNWRVQEVLRLLEGREIRCLGTTRAGHPKHPLYSPAAMHVPWP